MTNEMRMLMKAVHQLIKLRLVVTETDLNREFVFSEKLQDVADVKAACFLLAERGKVTILSNTDGGMVVALNNVNIH
jgi:Iap family predicted aminopeptidase